MNQPNQQKSIRDWAKYSNDEYEKMVQKHDEISERIQKDRKEGKKMGFFSQWLNDLWNSLFGKKYGYTDQVTFGGRKKRTRHNRKRKHHKHHGTRRKH